MNKLNQKWLAMCSAIVLSGAGAWADTEPILLISPPDYQVLNISHNGKWAVGVYGDYQSMQRGFLWNLESNEITMLSTDEESQGWTVSNGGVVCGSFTDHSIYENGAGTLMPGYYKDGQWNSVEVPEGFSGPEDNYHGAGVGYAITDDGRTMTGSLYINGQFSPCVWRDGKLVTMLDISNNSLREGNAYCISPDGKTVGGYAFRNNRCSALWNVADNTRRFISDNQDPWSSVNRFTPDGKKVIYGGGWDTSISAEADVQYYNSIYDLETGHVTSLPALDRNSTVAIYGISNSYTCVGSSGDYDYGRAVMYINGQGAPVLMEDYFIEKGVDFDEAGFHVNEEYGHRLFFRCQDVSADDNIYALEGYDDSYNMRSVIVMLNQDTEHAAPVSVATRQLSGLLNAEISWKAPVRSSEGIAAYRIYRDGKLVGEVPATATSFYDAGLEVGDYQYTVSTVYADGTEMNSNAPTLKIAAATIAKPESLSARQKGAYSLYAQWAVPGSNLISKRWYTPSTSNVKAFGIGLDAMSFEAGIGFDKAEMANYEGYSIRKVNFYPMSEQRSWTLNIYKYVGEKPERIYSQPITQSLNYKHINTVLLDKPVPVPTDGDLVVAIEVDVPQASMNVIGMDYGHSTPGYGDLLRLSNEPDFYSYYGVTSANGYPDYATFMIDAVLAREDQDLSVDEVKEYVITVDDEEPVTTTELEWQSNKLKSDTHTLKVQARFADGTLSQPISTSVAIKANYPKIDDVKIETNGGNVTFSWDTPVDADYREFCYSSNVALTTADAGITGPAETNYGFMAGIEYDSRRLKGYNGYQIKSLRFYPTADAAFTFMIYDEGIQVGEQVVDDYVLNQWNEIKLEDPITIDETHTYLIGLDCYDVEPEKSPLAVDNQLGISYVSDLVSTDDGQYWDSFAQISGLMGNWMMGMILVDQSENSLPVSGYDVRIDSKAVASRISDNTFTYDMSEAATGEHKVRVNVRYTGYATAINGTERSFVIKTTGIETLQAESYRLQLGTEQLVVEGSDVNSVSIIAANGAVVAQAVGNTVSMAQLPAGVYMVKAIVAAQELVYKIVIE